MASDKNNKKADMQDEKGKNDTVKAHDEAEKDIDSDPELDMSAAPEDDLDEGELARFEGEE